MKLKRLLLASTLLFGVFTATACGNNNSKVDYVHNGSVQLKLDYHNRDFYSDGVVQVDLAPKGTIDGDTVHFYPKTGSNQKVRIKARFYGVDTPESTGQIEPYGKDASDFTKQKILNASENGTIVVSSPSTTYTPPQADSTGGRYVLMVWINETVKNAPLDELYSLNLWLVQEGLSLSKGLDKMPQYKTVFDKAESQARRLKLKMFSGKEDPRYNYGEYEDVPFYQIAKEIQNGLKGDDPTYTYDGTKVHLKGTVAGYSNNSLYIQNFFTEDEGADDPNGEYVCLNIFCGMSEIPSRFQTLGTYIEVYGTAVNSQFGFQITSCYFPRTKTAETKTSCKVILAAQYNTLDVTEPFADSITDDKGKVIYTPTENEHGHKLKVFEMSSSDLSSKVQAQEYDLLFEPITITNNVKAVEKVGNSWSYMSDQYEASLMLENESFGVYIPYVYYPDVNDKNILWKELSLFLDKEYVITSCILAFHENNKGDLSIQFYPAETANFMCVDYIN